MAIALSPDGQSGPHSRHAGDVVSLRAVRLAAAEDHVLDFLLVELRYLAERVGDAVGRQVRGQRHVEGSAL